MTGMETRSARPAFLAGVVLVLFGGISVIRSDQLRPNVGFYEESMQAEKHPEFQRQLRTRIERNIW